MAMTSRNRLLAIAGGAVAVLVVGWLVVSNMADSRAERQLDEFLTEHGLRDHVHWKRLSASPFGSVRLDEVSVDARAAGGQELRIARVDIDDFVDREKYKRADLRLSGIADAEGFSPLGAFEYLRAGGRSQLPPATIRVDWALDLDDDDLVLGILIGQPEAMEARGTFELERVGALVRAGTAGPSVASPFGRPARAGAAARSVDPFAGIGGVFGMLEALGDVRIRRVELALRDDGYVRRSVALHKRYAIPVSAAGGSAERQRDEGFAHAIDGARAECEKEFPFGSSASERRRSCGLVLDFLSGKRSSLTLKLRPDHPVPFSGLMESGFQENGRLIQLLKPEIGS